VGQKDYGLCSEWLGVCSGVVEEILAFIDWSTVDCIEKGDFVEFTEFSMFDGTGKP